MLTQFSAQAQLSLPLSQIHITSRFGQRIHPVTGKFSFHSGIDLKAKYVQVKSILNGTIKEVGENPILGKYIKITHGKLESIYGHLSRILVRSEEQVSAGQVIAISGNTGRSTGPHLHFSIKASGKIFNPISALQALQQLTKNNFMENNQFQQQDELPLASLLLLLASQNQISLSSPQAKEYGVELADELPWSEEEDYGN